MRSLDSAVPWSQALNDSRPCVGAGDVGQPGVVALLPRYGGRLLAADTRAHRVEGVLRSMNAIIEFPSVEAALGLYDDPAYEPLKRLRQASTSNISMVLAARATPR